MKFNSKSNSRLCQELIFKVTLFVAFLTVSTNGLKAQGTRVTGHGNVSVIPIFDVNAVSNLIYQISTNIAFPSNTVITLVSNAMPFVIVSSKGITNGTSTLINDGKPFGPDTPGTTTSGINEAINSLYQTNAFGPISGGGNVYLSPGVFECTGQIVFPNDYPFNVLLQGAGKAATSLIYSGTDSNSFITVSRTLAGTNDATLNLTMYDMGLYYVRDTNKVPIMDLQFVNELHCENLIFSSYQSLERTTAGLVYRSFTPTNRLGIVGLRIRGNANNKMDFYHCSWYGLAAGIWTEADHLSLNDCLFGCIGRYSTNNLESGAYGKGTLWTTSDGSQGHILTNGPAVYTEGDLSSKFELNLLQCQFFTLRAAIAVGKNDVTCYNPIFEDVDYTSITSSSADSDIGRAVYFGRNLTLNDATANASTGLISGTNEGVFASFGAPAEGLSILKIGHAASNNFNLAAAGLTLPHLSGSGQRVVQADANGFLSAVLSTNTIGSGGGGTNGPWFTNVNDIYFLRVNNNPLTLGNVGIGTNTPHKTLEIHSAGGFDDGVPGSLLLGTRETEMTVGIQFKDTTTSNNWQAYLSHDGFRIGKEAVADYLSIDPNGAITNSVLSGSGVRLVEADANGKLNANINTNLLVLTNYWTINTSPQRLDTTAWKSNSLLLNGAYISGHINDRNFIANDENNEAGTSGLTKYSALFGSYNTNSGTFGDYNFISGQSNTINNLGNSFVGGLKNTLSGDNQDYKFVWGLSNILGGTESGFSTVFGKHSVLGNNSSNSVILGGISNSVTAYGATVIGNMITNGVTNGVMIGFNNKALVIGPTGDTTNQNIFATTNVLFAPYNTGIRWASSSAVKFAGADDVLDGFTAQNGEMWGPSGVSNTFYVSGAASLFGSVSISNAIDVRGTSVFGTNQTHSSNQIHFALPVTATTPSRFAGGLSTDAKWWFNHPTTFQDVVTNNGIVYADAGTIRRSSGSLALQGSSGLIFGLNSGNTLQMGATALWPLTDNAFDFGLAGAFRYRDIYISRQLTNGSAANQSGISLPTSGTVTIWTNLTTPGRITATNGFIVKSNTYPLSANMVELAPMGCITWMSNATLYLICTNSLDGNATTNKLGGL